jgi:hypothetical protein
MGLAPVGLLALAYKGGAMCQIGSFRVGYWRLVIAAGIARKSLRIAIRRLCSRKVLRVHGLAIMEQMGRFARSGLCGDGGEFGKVE